MNKKILCPSMMCADYGNLKTEVETLDKAGTNIFHCDIMDAEFVPNMTMGVIDIQTIRKYTDKMIDCHLMIENPSNKIDLFLNAGCDLIYIHPESETHVIRTLSYIREKGKLAGLAINPDTSIESIKEMLNFADYVMVMTVNPGFAGQKFIESTKLKVRELAKLKEQYGYHLMIDGACSPSIIKELSEQGCDGFILGTSALFGKEKTYETCMNELRNL